nr:MAG TPA: hypothetical protein [Caudoviricetes sp.]
MVTVVCSTELFRILLCLLTLCFLKTPCHQCALVMAY